VAQPALSRQVRALELELRETLLTRTGRGVVPTDAGRRLLEHGHAILQGVAAARDDLLSGRGEPVGRVTVGLPPSLARRLTPLLIERFQHDMPKARLEIVEAFSVTIAEWLGRARMDLGLVYSPASHPQIEAAPVLEERLRLIGPAGSLPPEGVAFADLARYPLVMPQRSQIFRKLMEAQATLSQVKLDVVWEVSSVPVILDLVRAGYGYAALTDSATGPGRRHWPGRGAHPLAPHRQHPVRGAARHPALDAAGAAHGRAAAPAEPAGVSSGKRRGLRPALHTSGRSVRAASCSRGSNCRSSSCGGMRFVAVTTLSAASVLPRTSRSGTASAWMPSSCSCTATQ